MQIRLLRNEAGVDEWMMIELQGTFEFETDISGKVIGQFAWLKDATACFILGHQVFKGEMVSLERPFLVVNKAVLRDEPSDQAGFPPNSNEYVKACDIAGVIKRKIVFRARPKPIITHGVA